MCRLLLGVLLLLLVGPGGGLSPGLADVSGEIPFEAHASFGTDILSEDAGEPGTIRLLFVGDIMVHAPQLEAAKRVTPSRKGEGGKGETVYDFAPFFTEIRSFLRGAHLAAGNLETTLGGPRKGYRGYPSFNSPDSLAEALRNAGFDLLFTANNHCLDSGVSGLLRTLQALASADLRSTGTFATEVSRDIPCIVERKGIAVGFLAYTYGTNGISVPSDRPWLVNLLDEALVSADVATLRKKTDLLVVAFHFGDEYARHPSAVQRRFVSLALRNGADIVVGSHPHVLQRLFVSRDVLPVPGERDTPLSADRMTVVAYSLGNFISFQRTVPRDTGAVLGIDAARDGDGIVRIRRVFVVPTWAQATRRKEGREIRVLPLLDTLARLDAGEKLRLSAAEEKRMRAALAEALEALTGKKTPLPPEEGVWVLWQREKRCPTPSR
jgi:poly-gamma-glutamate synthesis protein (capsule biosynthesis protein)